MFRQSIRTLSLDNCTGLGKHILSCMITCDVHDYNSIQLQFTTRFCELFKLRTVSHDSNLKKGTKKKLLLSYRFEWRDGEKLTRQHVLSLFDIPHR